MQVKGIRSCKMLDTPNVKNVRLLCNTLTHVPHVFWSGYMHEHGLGVPRDYDMAWTYYDRARRNIPDVADVDQRLDGMPIELLIAFARFRCVLCEVQLRTGLHGPWPSFDKTVRIHLAFNPYNPKPNPGLLGKFLGVKM